MYNNKPCVTILMATYNGAKFLSKQIESIIAQTYLDWQLVIRDDRSTDDTIQIIESFLSDGRIKLIKYGSDYGSACINFSNLIEWAKHNSTGYIMFSDQDDIWKDDKITKSVEFIENLELEYPETALLVYTKFDFITENGDAIHKQILLPSRLKTSTMLVENYAWGCTMIMNQKLLKITDTIPYNAVNHDYWLALLCSAFGKVILLDENLIYYRQHSDNVSGNVSNSFWKNRITRYITQKDIMIKHFAANLSTVILFFHIYDDKLHSEEKKLIDKYIQHYKSTSIALLNVMLNKKILKFGTLKNLTMFPFLFFFRSKIYKTAIDRLK